MKKLIKINGKWKKYNTETANVIGKWDNGLDPKYDDFEYEAVTLYQKQNGEFFLYEYGGPMSKHHRNDPLVDENWEYISPLTQENAIDWARGHLDCDESEALFGEVAE